LKWSTRELAFHSGVAFTTVHKFETGKPARKTTAAKITKAFDAAGVSLVVTAAGQGAILRAAGSSSAAELKASAAEAIVDFVVRILRVARTGDRAAKLGGAQLSALSTIRYNPGISLKALAVMEAVTHPTMSRLIASLVRAGWVAKQTDARDARFQRLSLTGTGLDAWDAARSRRVYLISRLVERLSPATVADIVAAVGPLADQIGTPPTPARALHRSVQA
jgi:DNA-binding MarR family transcriptional regulator